MNLKGRVTALEGEPKKQEFPPLESMYDWTHEEKVAWELANNPHLDPEKTVTDRQVRLDSYYN